MSSLFKLGAAVFGSSLSLFKKQCHAATDCDLKHPLVTPAEEPWFYDWDGRQNQCQQAKGVRNIFLIRHGQYQMQAPVKRLTNLGLLQADNLGRFLKKFIPTEFNLKEVDLQVYNSPVVRAEQTRKRAMIQSGLCNVCAITDNRLAEGCPIWPNPPYANYEVPWEDVNQVRSNLNDWFKEKMHRSASDRDSVELYFCHGNVTRFMTLKLLQMPLMRWSGFVVKHCSITWFKIFPDGRVSCVCMGDAGFLDIDQCTE